MYYQTYYHTTTVNAIDALYEHTLRFTLLDKYTVRKEETPTINTEALHRILDTEITDRSYTEYRIPKATGGYRTITAPSSGLKDVQRAVVDTLTLMKTYPHDAAYAYVTGRNCKQAIQKHQAAENKWFYKFDIKDFFPSCTRIVLTNVLKKVYPFCSFTDELMTKLMNIALYHDALPQGSPLSPLLSNMLLVPFDFKMHYSIKHFGGTYTRYADDILISLPERKDLSFLERIIQNHLNDEVSPTFRLNSEKSRCGSINGSNWNLGLMLNKDNKITIGHKNKMKLKAKINNFILDFTNGNFWSIIDTQVLQGEINYFKQIEPEYAEFMIKRLERKYNNITLSECIAKIITDSVI